MPTFHVSSGQLLVLYVGTVQAGGVSATFVSSITDSNLGGSSWHLDAGQNFACSGPPNQFPVGFIEYSLNHPTGNTNLTINFSNTAGFTGSNCAQYLELHDVPGIASASLDQYTDKTDRTGTSNHPVNAPTTTFGPEWLASMAFIFGGGNFRTIGPTNGYSELIDLGSVGTMTMYPAYLFSIAPGTYGTDWHSSATGCWTARQASWFVTPAAPMPTPTATATSTAGTPTPTATIVPTQIVICPTPGPTPGPSLVGPSLGSEWMSCSNRQRCAHCPHCAGRCRR